MTVADEDEFSELVDFSPDRVDGVGKPASGVARFLIAKQDAGAAGLLDPGFVRDLIAKQAGETEPSGRERVQMPNGVTLTGSPAAMAAFIHKASMRQAGAGDDPDAVAKEKYSAEDKREMLAAGHAIKNENGDPAYPIGDKDDLGKAVSAVGRGGPDHDRIRAYIIRRAKALGASSEIPDNWNSDGSLKQKVSKDMAGTGPELDDGIDGMDPTAPLAEPDEMGPGDPADPGSPAWESIDAATARKWTSIAVRFKNALGILAEREMLEAASADPDDAENAWDLEDAQSALDYVIGVLAGFAVDEQAEADLCGEAMEAIGKALGTFDPASLDAIEGLCAVAKSGRVLSAANEAHIRDAAAALNTVLSSLPKAPATDDGQQVAKQEGTTMAETQAAPETSAAQVAKETAAPEAQAAGTGPVNAGGTTGMGTPKGGPSEPLPGDVPGREVLKAALLGIYDQHGVLTGVASPAAIVQRVAKADDGGKVTMQAVFDENGNLVGIVDPADITPVAGAGGKPDDEAADGDDAAGDMNPEPPAEAGTPADAVSDDGTVTKQDGTATLTLGVLKSVIGEVVAAALGAQAPAQDVARQADVAGISGEVELLKARLAVVEEQPAAPRVFTNGAVPPPHQMRGQDRGAPPLVDVAKAREMKQRMYTADPAEANRIATELNQSAIATMAAIHAGQR